MGLVCHCRATSLSNITLGLGYIRFIQMEMQQVSEIQPVANWDSSRWFTWGSLSMTELVQATALQDQREPSRNPGFSIPAKASFQRRPAPKSMASFNKVRTGGRWDSWTANKLHKMTTIAPSQNILTMIVLNYFSLPHWYFPSNSEEKLNKYLNDKQESWMWWLFYNERVQQIQHDSGWTSLFL